MKLSFITFLLLCSFGCKETVLPDDIIPTKHIEYFGFVLIDTYWDDPSDTETKINYTDEVQDFTNVGDILVVNPTDQIDTSLATMHQSGMQVLLHLNELFFEITGTNSLSGVDYTLRTDYQERWNDFVVLNKLDQHIDKIAAWYIGEEPTWNGISTIELQEASRLLKSQFPKIPVMIIEAFPAIPDLLIPVEVDWIGFDQYFLADPTTHPEYLANWEALKLKRSRSDQKLVVIMDSHYHPDWHGAFGNLQIEDMAKVADNYYKFAQSDTSVVAILGYCWPNGFEDPKAIGARGMPEQALKTYKEIGKAILEE